MEIATKTSLQQRVQTALDNIRPYLEADGGNVQLIEITDNMTVKLALTGACSTCPMSNMTLKAGVEQTIRQEVPEIRAVEAVNL